MIIVILLHIQIIKFIEKYLIDKKNNYLKKKEKSFYKNNQM